jgi:hypothetical protein
MKNIIKKITAKMGYQTDKKQILLLSDDWGSVRIKSTQDQEALVKKGLIINNRFDQYDSLETNEDLELLFEVLTKYKDHNGNHPCITAVTNVANPDFKKIKESDFQEYHYETIASTYLRYPDSDRVLNLTHEGIHNKIFIPQSHGREHVQVNWWMEELQNKDSFASKFFDHEFFFLYNSLLKNNYRGRDIVAAFDVLTQDDLDSQIIIAKDSLIIFDNLFGFKSKIFTPPALFYNPQIEEIIKREGIDWIDVGRLFKVPQTDGTEKWQFNYLGRKKKSGLKVLVRNAMFESNISQSESAVDRCLYDIEQAFKLRQPAIISNHRACFTGRIDDNNRRKGLFELDLLFSRIVKKWPDVEFISINELNF